ncbi:hypothetical protein [Vibrio sp. RE88]|uniref:hypothetical protein n=1 Tax=Vibrio sp. RE88 TaxID=2607610 RepID=UPI0014936EA8|nr:hypothetical protein [Vibrio sp. RE88]NOH60573.1 hypothetical protein [Vibrio sp. RE88]
MKAIFGDDEEISAQLDNTIKPFVCVPLVLSEAPGAINFDITPPKNFLPETLSKGDETLLSGSFYSQFLDKLGPSLSKVPAGQNLVIRYINTQFFSYFSSAPPHFSSHIAIMVKIVM